MVDDVNFVMAKCSPEGQALQTKWIERCKEALANGHFARLKLSESEVWKDAGSSFWKEKSIWLWSETEDQRFEDHDDHDPGSMWSDSRH